MGFAASQARFLTLTARQSDIEYKAQQICNSRLELTRRLEQIATEYTEAISNRALFTSQTGYSSDFNQQVSTTNLASQGLQVLVVNQGVLFDDYTPGEGEIKKSLEEGLRDGTYVLLRQSNPFSQESFTVAGLSGTYETTDWRTNANIGDNLFEADDADAEAKYQAATDQLHNIDKRLTLETTKLDTEHKAVESELEAVKQLIQKGAEGSFKTFA